MSRTVVVEAVYCECSAPNLPSSTVCGECGASMKPPTVPQVPALQHGPECPCNPCTLEMYEPAWSRFGGR